MPRHSSGPSWVGTWICEPGTLVCSTERKSFPPYSSKLNERILKGSSRGGFPVPTAFPTPLTFSFCRAVTPQGSSGYLIVQNGS